MDSAKIDQIIEKHRGKPGALIHVLMEIQHENHWLPRDVLHKVADGPGRAVQPGDAASPPSTRPSV